MERGDRGGARPVRPAGRGRTWHGGGARVAGRGGRHGRRVPARELRRDRRGGRGIPQQPVPWAALADDGRRIVTVPARGGQTRVEDLADAVTSRTVLLAVSEV